MFINIVGAIIYFLGVFFTFAWGINLRYRAKTGQRERIFEVFGLLMVISLILIPTLSLSPFHLLWMFPISFILAPLSILFPLNLLLWPLASLYASFWYIGLSDEGYKGGLVSRVKNKHSGKRYIISTAQEIGKDYWTTVVLPARFFGLLPDGFKPLLTWVRNTKEKAHEVHWMIKKIVAKEPEDKWIEVAPSPIPPDGYSEDAKKTFKEKLGFIPREVQLLEKKEHQENLKDLIYYFRLKNWIEEKTKKEENIKKNGFLKGIQDIPEEKQLREEIRKNPNDYKSRTILGSLLNVVGRYDEAEKELREAIRINPNFGLGHYSLGLLLEDLKRYDEAEKEYREAIRIDPNVAVGHYSLALLLINLKRYDEAEKELKEVIRIDPNFGEAHLSLGGILYIEGKKDEAKEEFLKARESFERQGKTDRVRLCDEILQNL